VNCPRCNGPLKRSTKRQPGHVVLGCLACKIVTIEEEFPEGFDWLDTTDTQFLSKLNGLADTIDHWRGYVGMVVADEDWE
jgi:hypothetical protein